ncbi:MAG: hypothetical protein R2875_12145 [Desulfobacterales bacterium]
MKWAFDDSNNENFSKDRHCRRNECGGQGPSERTGKKMTTTEELETVFAGHDFQIIAHGGAPGVRDIGSLRVPK